MEASPIGSKSDRTVKGYLFKSVQINILLNVINLENYEKKVADEVRLEAYLYKDSLFMIERGKGNRQKLEVYGEKRIRKLEDILKISRPFKIIDGNVEIDIP